MTVNLIPAQPSLPQKFRLVKIGINDILYTVISRSLYTPNSTGVASMDQKISSADQVAFGWQFAGQGSPFWLELLQLNDTSQPKQSVPSSLAAKFLRQCQQHI
eukprot:gb/GEZN01019742.1/.p1 GENE.gb/GEZN01019742.1/~~gb/GEZN01019742.1/.p1  ORF type:complete len:103 (+),score=10.29 gb/GEZN01019742.1/:146-454(+)